MARYDKKAYLELKELEKSLKLTSNFWKKCHEYVKKWIHADMRAGILQTVQKHHTYISEAYKKYKANWGRRLTFDTKQGRVSGSKLKKSGSKYKSGNKRVFNGGGSIVSNRTNTVDMLLTGQLIQGLHFVSSTALGGISSYDAKDAGKIEGNRKLGREICTLREENRQKLIKKVSAALDVNIRQWAKEKVYINYGNK